MQRGGSGPAAISVPDVPYSGKRPKCPATDPNVRRWWTGVSRLPHCALWGADEWAQLDELALLRQAILAGLAAGNPSPGILTEARHRADSLGLSADARRRLGIVYVAASRREEATSGEWLAAVPGV